MVRKSAKIDESQRKSQEIDEKLRKSKKVEDLQALEVLRCCWQELSVELYSFRSSST